MEFLTGHEYTFLSDFETEAGAAAVYDAVSTPSCAYCCSGSSPPGRRLASCAPSGPNSRTPRSSTTRR